jgi:hypothetical protein
MLVEVGRTGAWEGARPYNLGFSLWAPVGRVGFELVCGYLASQPGKLLLRGGVGEVGPTAVG